jgi:uncharacterized repeat protein (TIGR01451 family)
MSCGVISRVATRVLLAGALLITVCAPFAPPLQAATVTNSLAVQMIGPGQAFINDWISYRLFITNNGPTTSSSIVLSNGVPPGVILIGRSPSDAAFNAVPGAFLFDVGTLTNGEGRAYSVTVQPTLARSSVFSLAPLGEGISGGTTISITNEVSSPQLGEITATIISQQQFNPQTGLMEQTVQLSNTTSSAISNSRLVVSGLSAANRLYNAIGTNDGNPFVVHSLPLPTNGAVRLLLEYFVPQRVPVFMDDSAFTAYPGVGVLNTASNATTAITVIKVLAGGQVLIEFEAVEGHGYRIAYSDNSDFTNPLFALPAITAPANRVQWIDSGPPKTITAVSNITSRFYRVVEIP